MRIPRTRGAISGLVLVVAGAWGAIVPFIGPSFHLTIGPNATFHWTAGRGWLSVLPGAVALLGGLIVLFSAHRARALLGAQMGLAAGVWFLIGPTLSQLWTTAPGAMGQAGFAAGNEGHRVLEALTYFYGVGAVITAFAALAIGRLTVHGVRDAELAAAAAAGDGYVAGGRRTGRFTRGRDLERRRVAEPAAVGAPTAVADAPTARDEPTVARGPATTAPRRRGGLLGRFRRS